MDRAPPKDSPSSIRVFGIPELAQLIYKHLTKQDIIVLSHVCRQLHSSVVPLIWETVENLSAVISLIPDVEVSLNTEANPSTVRQL